MPPVDAPDIMGDAINICFSLGRGRHKGKLVITGEAYRKLDSQARDRLQRYEEPAVCVVE